MISAESLRTSIDRGTRFLVGDLARRTDGLWRDYIRGDGTGGSNVWVSAFIAAQIGKISTARTAARSVVSALLSLRRRSGGWGYDKELLEDADSTAWVLLAASATGTALPREVLIAAIRFLLEHQRGDGGFVTYGPEGERLFGDIAGRDGWFRSQPCVTAAVLAACATYVVPELPAIAESVAFLERVAVDDLWYAYWWYGPAYATCHSVRALSKVGQLTKERAETIAAAMLRSRNEDGGWDGRVRGRSLAFTTALAVQTLLELGARDPAVAVAVRLLLSFQQPDGSFEQSAELLVPGGAGAGRMTMLDHGWFTTACVLNALNEYVNRLAAAKDGAPCQPN